MAETPVVSEQLRRTLSFFGGEGADYDFLSARSHRGRKTFLVFTAKSRTPLLQPAAIELLCRRLAINESWLLDVSSIPMRTFHRRQKQDQPFTETETDRVLRIARVASQAERVFGSEEKARRWLSKENRMLGAKPLDLLATDAGAHEVEAELNRIDLGDFT